MRPPDEDPAAMTTEPETSAIDTVCGMTVDVATARAADLALVHEGREYVFCGRGCKLDFADDPGRHLDPGHVPSM
jgi:YHS domain-containing protein